MSAHPLHGETGKNWVSESWKVEEASERTILSLAHAKGEERLQIWELGEDRLERTEAIKVWYTDIDFPFAS